MSTLPRQRSGSSFRWLIPIGALVLAGGIAALVASGNEEAVKWLQDNSTCNEQPCSYEEAKNIMVGLGAAGAIAGAVMMVIGLWRLLRGGSPAPQMPAGSQAPVPIPDAGPPEPVTYGVADPEPIEPAARDAREPGFGFPDRELGDSPADRLTALDAELAAGRLEMDEYLSRRERILNEM